MGIRTPDLNTASVALSQLSYSPALKAQNQDRTGDLALTKGVLCRLSYLGPQDTHYNMLPKSRQVDSNHRPVVYETTALPLSYDGR